MCGIVGIAGSQEPNDIERMNAAIQHRGPDDFGVFTDRGISIGMRRLSIIDSAGGHQPMSTADGRYVLVYNGEIFNAAELRAQLERQGTRFVTNHSDTEVLLAMLVEHGEAALPRLNGMFAFALLDRQEQTILCARDRFGIKPFYYSMQGGRFAFASEVKALLELPWVTRTPRIESLFHYFSLHYVPGNYSAFDGIERLPPATLLRFDVSRSRPKLSKWWEPTFGTAPRQSDNETTERLSAALTKAVRLWTISDEPVGCLLSGGLDSSAIVSMLAQHGQKLKTFTVGFKGPGEEDWDELALARQIAKKWGTEHHEILLEPEALLDDLVDMVFALDEPYAGGLPSWAVFKAMGSNVKVAMTGTGGDELFGNYNKFLFLEGRYRSRIPFLGRKQASYERFRRDLFERYYYAADAEKRATIVESERFAGVGNTHDVLWREFAAGPEFRSLRDRVVNMDLATQLPDEFLLMTDRFSMAHSIEARTPFLDHELAAEVYAIDASRRLSSRTYKPLLRRIVRNFLPADLMRAPKRGFVLPLKLWLRGRLQPCLQRLLAPERLAQQRLIRPDFYERFAAPHMAGRVDNTHRLWNMLMFQLWWDVFVTRIPRDEIKSQLAERR